MHYPSKILYKTTQNIYVSSEFDKFRVAIHLCKLRDAPAARFYTCVFIKSYSNNVSREFDKI